MISPHVFSSYLPYRLFASRPNFSSLLLAAGVGMLSKSFFSFRSLAPHLSLFFSFSFLPFLAFFSFFCSLDLNSDQEYFLLLHGCVLPGISHIYHVITVIFSVLRHVALPLLPFDSSRRGLVEDFVSIYDGPHFEREKEREFNIYRSSNFSVSKSL